MLQRRCEKKRKKISFWFIHHHRKETAGKNANMVSHHPVIGITRLGEATWI